MGGKSFSTFRAVVFDLQVYYFNMSVPAFLMNESLVTLKAAIRPVSDFQVCCFMLSKTTYVPEFLITSFALIGYFFLHL